MNSLYHRDGVYYYTKGINPRADDRAGLGRRHCAGRPVLSTPLHFLYDYAWFVGFFTAGILYVAMMKLVAPEMYAPAAEEA